MTQRFTCVKVLMFTCIYLCVGRPSSEKGGSEDSGSDESIPFTSDSGSDESIPFTSDSGSDESIPFTSDSGSDESIPFTSDSGSDELIIFTSDSGSDGSGSEGSGSEGGGAIDIKSYYMLGFGECGVETNDSYGSIVQIRFEPGCYSPCTGYPYRVNPRLLASNESGHSCNLSRILTDTKKTALDLRGCQCPGGGRGRNNIRETRNCTLSCRMDAEHMTIKRLADACLLKQHTPSGNFCTVYPGPSYPSPTQQPSSTQPSTIRSSNTMPSTTSKPTTTKLSTTNVSTGSSAATMVIEIRTEDYNGINVYGDATRISTNRAEVANIRVYVSVPPDLFSKTLWSYAPKIMKFIFSINRKMLPDVNSNRLLDDISFGIEVENVTIKNLSTPFLMIIHHQSPLKEGYRHECVFLNQSGHWDTEGCRTEEAYGNTSCHCDHFSFFGALLIRDVPVSEVHVRVLQLLSYVGCSISVTFCIVTLMSHCLRHTRESNQTLVIHLCLVGALLLLNLLFLCSVGIAPLHTPGLCTALALLLHYALLCSFTWMGLEAVHLYRMTIKVYNTYVRHYLRKISLLGWGAPALVACIIIAVDPEFYGLIDTGAGEMCWIRSLAVHYSTVVAYFVLVLLFNSGVLSFIVMKTFHLRTQKSSQEKGQHARLVCSILGLTCALGLTWGLAFLSWGYPSMPVLYAFTVLNPLQGFFMCTWIWVLRCRRAEPASCTTQASLELQPTAPPDPELRATPTHAQE